MDRWREKVAVVTGASEGIGAAIARRLAMDGMKVAALARRAELLEEFEREVNNSGVPGKVKGYICDVSSESDVTAAFRSIEEDFGAISLLVNNAGVFKPVLPTDMDLEGAKTMIDVNVNGVLHCIKAGVASMKRHSINDGHIVNISSIAGHRIPDSPYVGVYSATKHALNVISATLRGQLKKENSRIRVSSVSPGVVKTPLTSKATNFALEQCMLPEDIAAAVIYAIASPPHVNVSEIILDNVCELTLKKTQ